MLNLNANGTHFTIVKNFHGNPFDKIINLVLFRTPFCWSSVCRKVQRNQVKSQCRRFIMNINQYEWLFKSNISNYILITHFGSIYYCTNMMNPKVLCTKKSNLMFSIVSWLHTYLHHYCNTRKENAIRQLSRLWSPQQTEEIPIHLSMIGADFVCSHRIVCFQPPNRLQRDGKRIRMDPIFIFIWPYIGRMKWNNLNRKRVGLFEWAWERSIVRTETLPNGKFHILW